MNKPSTALLLAALLLPLWSCHDVPEYESDAVGNFDALWSVVDEHYCFFEEKNVDWDSVRDLYRPLINERTNIIELFQICAGMLNSLRDGHVNLTSSFNTSYYRKWWSDYPQNYNERIVQQYYLEFKYYSVSGAYYYLIGDGDDIGYMRYPSFSYTLGDSSLDYILALLSDCRGLIIDLRDNGGGDMTNVEALVSRFISKRTLAGYIRHKTGKGHSDFSEPFAYYYEPAPSERIRWEKPVVLLTNRSTFSAANNFVAVMKYLPNVRVVGATTGGGSGMPYSYEIPIGWGLRMSSCPVYDCNMTLTENGVEPSEGCAVDLDQELALDGIDTMLERAIEVIDQMSPPKPEADRDGK